MKRSTCLSALLVGLSMTMASAALAAPPAQAKKPAKSVKAKAPADADSAKPPATDVAQTQPTDPPPAQPEGTGGAQPAPAPAEPAAAEPTPAAPAAEPTQPAITLGTGTTPGTDSPQTAPEEPKAKPKPRPWAGSSIFAYTSTTTATIFKNQQQYSNPTVDSSIWLTPRYAINDAFQLRGLVVYNYEWTNSDDTTTKHEPRFSDTTLSLWYRKIPEVLTIKPSVAVSAGIPTSPESRARTLIFTPGATLQLVKGFEHVIGGELTLISSLIYSHPLYRNTTSEIRGDFPYSRQCAGDGCAGQLSGTFNTSDSLGYTLLVSGEWGKWNPAIYYRGTSRWDYTGKNIKEAQVIPGGSNRDIQSGQSQPPTHVRQTSYFSVWLDYNANSWFTAEVGYWLERSSLLTEESNYGNPFFDKYQDMRVYLGASFQIDNIVKQLEGGTGEAGIVRAKNTKSPMWTY